MTNPKTAVDYPWQVNVHTLPEDFHHPLYSVTTSPLGLPSWLIAAPLDHSTAEHIADLHNNWLEGR